MYIFLLHAFPWTMHSAARIYITHTHYSYHLCTILLCLHSHPPTIQYCTATHNTCQWGSVCTQAQYIHTYIYTFVYEYIDKKPSHGSFSNLLKFGDCEVQFPGSTSITPDNWDPLR